MTNERAMEMIAARRARIVAAGARQYYDAASAWFSVADAASPPSEHPSTGDQIGDALRMGLVNTLRSIAQSALFDGMNAMAGGIAALTSTDDPCEVARWNLTTRGYRLPLP